MTERSTHAHADLELALAALAEMLATPQDELPIGIEKLLERYGQARFDAGFAAGVEDAFDRPTRELPVVGTGSGVYSAVEPELPKDIVPGPRPPAGLGWDNEPTPVRRPHSKRPRKDSR